MARLPDNLASAPAEHLVVVTSICRSLLQSRGRTSPADWLSPAAVALATG